jgi:hypothetical protein
VDAADTKHVSTLSGHQHDRIARHVCTHPLFLYADFDSCQHEPTFGRLFPLFLTEIDPVQCHLLPYLHRMEDHAKH